MMTKIKEMEYGNFVDHWRPSELFILQAIYFHIFYFQHMILHFNLIIRESTK